MPALRIAHHSNVAYGVPVHAKATNRLVLRLWNSLVDDGGVPFAFPLVQFRIADKAFWLAAPSDRNYRLAENGGYPDAILDQFDLPAFVAAEGEDQMCGGLALLVL